MAEHHSHTERKGCPQWLKAQQPGTDSEAYGRLVTIWAGEPSIGCELEPIEFCPWCGAQLRPLTDEQRVTGEQR